MAECKAMGPDCMHAGAGKDPSYCPDCGDPAHDPRRNRPVNLLESVNALRGPSLRRQKLAAGECSYCDRETSDFHPPHDASPNCESGKRSHCSCETCF